MPTPDSLYPDRESPRPADATAEETPSAQPVVAGAPAAEPSAAGLPTTGSSAAGSSATPVAAVSELPGDEHWNNRANWKFGLFYAAADDPRVWVPKRSTLGRRRLGVTPNMARPEARRYLMWVLIVFCGVFSVLYLLEQWGG